MSTTSSNRKRIEDDYLALIIRFPLVPIRNLRHFREAIQVLDEIAVIDENKLSQGQMDYLLVLTDLVEQYEDKHSPGDMDALDGIDVLKSLMEESKMTANDLGHLLGNSRVGKEIIGRKRLLTTEDLLKLSDRFKVNPGLFLQTKAG